MGNTNKIFLMNMVFLCPSLSMERMHVSFSSLNTMNNSRAGPAFLLAQKSRRKYQPSAVLVSEGKKNTKTSVRL